jgi:S1-C subfamily serine protease
VNNFRRTLAAVCLAAGIALGHGAHAQLPVSAGESQVVLTLAPLLKTITPSVVSIAIRRRMTDEEFAVMNDPLFKDPREPSSPSGDRTIYASGSGVIIDAEKGYIVTGSHVVEGADEILVILSDGRRLTARITGLDQETDIAVVKIRAAGLTSVVIGDSDRVEVGDFVLAIGNPFAIGQTVTSGIVSALRRRSLGDRGYEDFIQTDAAINLGSSGGALINLRGELVGMNAAILGAGGGNVGIGFAIPANTVRIIANQLITYGAASHGELGFAVAGPQGDLFQGTDVPDRTGAVITKVEPGSSAARAGVRPGDVVVTFNSLPVRDPADLHIKTTLLRVGDVVDLGIFRDRQTITVRTTLMPKTEKKNVPKRATVGRPS